MKQVNLVLLLVFKLVARYFKRSLSLFRSSPPRRFNFNFLKQRQRLLAALFALVVAWVLGSSLAETLFYRPTIVEGIVGVYTQNNLPSPVLNLISEPLVVLDQSSKPQPKLAGSWQINNDATQYTFTLREGLAWHDGTPVRSRDINFILNNVEIGYPDESTIQFKLSDSFSALPSLLTTPILKKDTLIGVGRYKVSDVRMSHGVVTKLTLTPNGQSDLPNLEIRFYFDGRAIQTAYQLGEINVVFGGAREDETLAWPGTRYRRLENFNRMVAIFYNLKDPLLADKNLRKALNAASPRVENEVRAVTSVQPGSWGFNGNLKDLLDNPQQSKEYLKKAELSDSQTVVLTTSTELASLGERIIQAWREVGINAILRTESGVPQNFQALLLTQPIPPDLDQYALWHSTQTATNVSKYSSARVDRDLEDGRKSTDHNLRRERYLDLQRVIAEDVPATFLYFPKTIVVYRPKLESELNKILHLQLGQK